MRYQVKDPQGKLHIIEGPEGATPDQVLAQAQKLLPQQKATGFDLKSTMGSAVKNMFQRPAGFAKDIGTNPQTMANVMPTALGTVGGISPIPGGATMGTAAGQVIRDLALKGLGKPIPGGLVHATELGGSFLGDLMAIPALKKSYFGKQIGKAEELAGLNKVVKQPPPANMRTAVVMAQKIKEMPSLTPEQAKAFKPAIDSVFQSGFITKGAYKQYLPDFVQASQKIQQSLNQIPGRLAPSEAMAKALTLPRMLNKPIKWAWNKLPALAARGARWGVIGVP